MTKDEALRIALDAFNSKYIVNSGAWRVQQDQAAKACEKALAHVDGNDTSQERVDKEAEKRHEPLTLTEKNLEATLLNLTKTDKPIKIKPTTWFGNPAKTAQWYTCPNCAKQSPLTLEWVGLTDDEIKEIVGPYGDAPIKGYTRKLFDQIEAALRSKNT